MDNNNDAVNEMAENPRSTLFKLAIPSVVSLLCVLFNTFLDSVWVSGLGNIEVSAVGLTSPIFYLLTIIGMGLGTSINVSLSKSLAEKNVLEANSIVKNMIILVILFSILLPLIILPNLGSILNLIGVGETYDACYEYVSILIFFIGIFYAADIFPFFLRLQGYVKIPVYITFVTCVLNMILDPIFIYSLNLGLKGAAMATVISVAASATLLYIMILYKRSDYVAVGEYKYNWDRDLEVMKKNLRIAGPIFFQSMGSLLFGILLNRFFVYEGLIYITAYSFAGKLLSFVTIPLNAISSSMLTVIGFLIGSGKWDEIKPNFKYALYVVEIFTIVPCVIFFIGSDFLSYFLYQTKDLLVINQISLGIKLLSVFYIFQVGALLIDAMFLSIEKPEKSFIIIFIGIVLDIIVLCIMEYNLHINNSVYYVLLVGSIVQIPVYRYVFRKDLNNFLEKKRSSDENSSVETQSS